MKKNLLKVAALIIIVPCLILLAGPVILAAGAVPLVWDLRVIVSQEDVGGTPKSVATLMFSPPPASQISSYPFCKRAIVYRHRRVDGRNFIGISSDARLYKASPTSPWEVRSGINCGSAAPAGWGIDPFYGYFTYKDTNGNLGLTDYEEYYYLVWTEADGTTLFQDNLNKYVVVAAFPPTQTRHGSYSEYTNACTTCHGLHSAKHQKLLKGPTVADLCGTCHDGTGSKYDEVRGTVRLGPNWGKRAYTTAGPFGDQLKANSGVITTSVHNVYRDAGPDWASVWQAPGSGFVKYNQDNTLNNDAQETKNGEPVWTYISSAWYSKLTCSTCHEPHNRSRNYRLLRGVINDWTNIVVRGFSEVNPGYAVSDQDPADPSRCLGSTCDQYDDRGEWAGRAMYTKFLFGTERFCIACHRAFYSQDSAGRYPTVSGDQPLDSAAGASPNNVWGGHRHAVGLAAKRAANYPIDGVWWQNGGPCGMSVPNENNSGDIPCGVQAGVTDPVLPLQGRAASYADNFIVCMTCHVPHGSGSERVEVAYRNDGANMTQQAGRDAVSGYLWNRADRVTTGGPVPAEDGASHSRGATPVSPGRDLNGNGVIECTAINPAYDTGLPQTECPTEGGWPRLDLYLPNDSPYWTQFGLSSALARFNPFTQVCYRCHGLRPQ